MNLLCQIILWLTQQVYSNNNYSVQYCQNCQITCVYRDWLQNLYNKLSSKKFILSQRQKVLYKFQLTVSRGFHVDSMAGLYIRCCSSCQAWGQVSWQQTFVSVVCIILPVIVPAERFSFSLFSFVSRAFIAVVAYQETLTARSCATLRESCSPRIYPYT